MEEQMLGCGYCSCTDVQRYLLEGCMAGGCTHCKISSKETLVQILLIPFDLIFF